MLILLAPLQVLKNPAGQKEGQAGGGGRRGQAQGKGEREKEVEVATPTQNMYCL